LSLTYEPGYRWFKGSGDASPNFIVPSDTYEGRVHLRLRNDALERNLMELPHRGYAFGGDFFYGHRTNWRQWGGVAFEKPNADRERDYIMGSFYALVATGIPWIKNERHRLIVSFYGGIGKNLDRFSAFRLPGRPTGYEWEALSLPILPSVAFNELVPTRYAVVHATYRYEAAFSLSIYSRFLWVGGAITLSTGRPYPWPNGPHARSQHGCGERRSLAFAD
jgi:hypothetical protein